MLSRAPVISRRPRCDYRTVGTRLPTGDLLHHGSPVIGGGATALCQQGRRIVPATVGALPLRYTLRRGPVSSRASHPFRFLLRRHAERMLPTKSVR
ncbi:hypothetical protein OG883_33760 [Streptomyces sp. NBC_01142]|uniref:hypothetical protein n=1 Tax=Streptomyces sp. NBC_01142 TaxID=2975865 RepID=UPI00224FB470|nr:hypothetical protein [Streptomyces sp. NBC_01142]MCX4824737.1 hypothetical protein [Streptomyces sp. NBC_01142]